MTRLCELSPAIQAVLPILLFLAVLCELILLMLQGASRRERLVHMVTGCAAAAALLVMTYLYSTDGETPVLPAVIALALALLHVPAEMVSCVKYRQNHLSPYAIKEATDDLPSGVCFADASGRIILCNRQMARLAACLLGSYPQTAGELEDALAAPPADSGVTVLPDEPVLHRFPDHTVWRFRRAALTDGICQLTAQNVTALHEINEKLREDNAALQKINQKLRRMYDRMADHIREQETLDLKMRIHDNIGASLIAISDMLRHDMDTDLGAQLAVLEDAVSYLTEDRPAPRGTFAEAKQKARAMKVDLVLRGSIPQNTTAEGLIVAAAKECVTNCVKHAGGSRVTVEITGHRDILHITITNDGAVPRGKIVEGGGLSNLRSSVEAAGGEMAISHSPAFALILDLPEKEPEL